MDDAARVRWAGRGGVGTHMHRHGQPLKLIRHEREVKHAIELPVIFRPKGFHEDDAQGVGALRR